jgi:hypothetical protein
VSTVFEPQACGPSFRAPLMGGESGTSQTIDLMRQLIDQAMADASVVRLAGDIVRRVRPYDELGEAQAIYNWVKSHMRFTKDPVTKETLFPPQELLKRGAGDCDDISMLMATLDMAVGIPARLVTVAGNPTAPGEFSHVYVEAEVPAGSDNWVPQDAARARAQFGDEPPHYFRKKVWSLTDNFSQDVDLSGYAMVPEFPWPGRRYGLGAYTEVGPLPWLGRRYGLGDFSDYAPLLTQSIQQIPADIAAAQGGATQYTTQFGTTATGPTNPYSSFATEYTPGFGIPGAGYPLLDTTGSLWPWIVGAGALLILAWSHK